MSGRTLPRRLSALGYSYHTLVDESRRQLAERLLQQTDYSSPLTSQAKTRFDNSPTAFQ